LRCPATKLQLSAEQLARLDAVSALPPVFPYALLDDPEDRQRIFGGQLDQFQAPACPIS
jgi:hypothetical protein